ncbi:MAG: LPS export ABC transporter periplasmic protein LptC, partial [Vicinamibacterales bacterium]
MAWQKRARLGVAIFGIACAIGVYAAMGERDKPVPAPEIERVDPKAIIESQGNVLQQVRGVKQDYLIKADQQLTYEGGASKLVGVEISVRNRGGRDYVITAREAQAGERQQELRLTGDVTLVASDGFEISAAEAFFSEGDGTVRTPGAFAFRRGRMHGTGIGMLYDKNTDILTITEKATVSLTSEDESMVTEFTAGSSVFTRPLHLLTLGGLVHVVRGEQVIDADQGVAHLSDDDGQVGLIELRGHSRVMGSGAQLDSLTARDIDLSYAADGRTLEHVVLRGEGAVGTDGREEAQGRQIFGESLDISLAPDGSLTRLVGRDGVRLNLAAAPDAPARSISARTLDGIGEGEKGLTAVRFAEDVAYTEAARRETAARLVRSRTLDVALQQDVVRSAAFAGAVTFEEQELLASGAEMLYEPGKGTLRLKGRDAGGGPRVADAQLTVEATTIDIALAGRTMSAAGSVNTTLRPRTSTPPAADRAGQARASETGGRGIPPRESSKLPG